MTDYQPYTPPMTAPSPTGSGTVPLSMSVYPTMPYPGVMPGQRPEHPQATTVLVLGILSFIVAGVLGPVAWYMGNKAMRECAAGMYTASDQLKVGRVLGIVATVLLGIGVVAIMGMIALGLFAAAVYR
ncbi:MAG: hypothetical protein LBV00_02885 [Propionibacteriaceae bacterium]|nr:hypothetical protein [Propionibacteriaceae bacterium]